MSSGTKNATDAGRSALRCADPGGKMGKLMIASLTMATASVAWASVPVGTPVGAAVGVAVGDVLGQITGLSFGAVLPGSGLLVVAAVSLAVGARIARRKQQRKNNESHV